MNSPSDSGMEDEVDRGSTRTGHLESTDVTHVERDEHSQDLSEEEYQPDYTIVNQYPFAKFCEICTTLYSQKHRPAGDKHAASRDQKLAYILPGKLRHKLGATGSPFPLLRLYMPEIDTSRPHTGMKEATIARVYADALNLGPDSRARLRLLNFCDPAYADGRVTGDLSLVVEEVVAGAQNYKRSKTTVGQINCLLEELVEIKHSKRRSHDWQLSGDQKKKKGPTILEQRKTWLRKLMDQYRLSPLEHRWMVRLLLQKIEIGLGHKIILKYYSPYALELYNANNSLKSLCTTLSNPQWVMQRKIREEREQQEQLNSMVNYMPRSSAIAELGNTISPMLAKRTSFAALISDLSLRHRECAKKLSADALGGSNLALKFPPLICEVKLDGERFIAHVNRGVVTLQTRNSTWYSKLYSPVIGPSLRRAIAAYDVDIILDGEVLSWDDAKKEVIPFGMNRGVANARRAWMEKHGMIDVRDKDPHNGEDDVNALSTRSSFRSDPSNEADDNGGSDCWLKYLVFDVLYVGGPGAASLIAESLSLKANSSHIQTGSILNLDGLQRKRVLHTLLSPKENLVDFVPSLVVRPNGDSMRADEYFATPKSSSCIAQYALDSIDNALRGEIADLDEQDIQTRKGRTDEEISILRARAMDQFYVDIVDRQRLEGVIFKDLTAPYVLGEESRSLNYWFKHKPDYEKNYVVADIDTAVLGAFYATGMAKAGILNGFLVGCVDNENPGHYLTLCRVSGGGMKKHKLDAVLDYTGYRRASEENEVQYGKWFKETDHGVSLPDFISARTFQTRRSKGWIFERNKTYPDLWIQPDDSFVLAIRAGELVASDAFSAGLTLRFPRIDKVRVEGADGDPKPVWETESVKWFHEEFERQESARREASAMDFAVGSAPTTVPGRCRFLTVEEREVKRKTRGPRAKAAWKAEQVPTVMKQKSAALHGLTVAVLEGTYTLDETSLDAEEARAEGWFEEAKKVSSQLDVIVFVKSNGGIAYIGTTGNPNHIVVGGHRDDARVQGALKAMRSARDNLASSSAADKETLEAIRLIPGILKWTYLFSSVHRWICDARKTKVEEGEELPSLQPRGSEHQGISMWKPRRHDYLIVNPSFESTAHIDLFGLDPRSDVTSSDLKRALEEVHRQKLQHGATLRKRRKPLPGILPSGRTSEEGVPWQALALDDNERTILTDPRHILGFGQTQLFGPDVFFPDVFPDSLDLLKNRWGLEDELATSQPSQWNELAESAKISNIMSVLPLASQMGAQLSPRLHEGVTHVLCELEHDSYIRWDPGSFDSSGFTNPSGAHRLHRRLLTLHANVATTPTILFVSPDWLRDRWIERA